MKLPSKHKKHHFLTPKRHESGKKHSASIVKEIGKFCHQTRTVQLPTGTVSAQRAHRIAIAAVANINSKSNNYLSSTEHLCMEDSEGILQFLSQQHLEQRAATVTHHQHIGSCKKVALSLQRRNAQNRHRTGNQKPFYH